MGSASSGGERSFSGDRKAAWEGFLQSQARLMQRLGHELEEAGKVPLSTYDVLVQLAEAGGRLRLRDLVDRVVLSQPGLSRKVARLEEEGLVEPQRAGGAAQRRGGAHRRRRTGLHRPHLRRRGAGAGPGVRAAPGGQPGLTDRAEQ